jgi:glycosyltransferase involved in cell wall biosynthesis
MTSISVELFADKFLDQIAGYQNQYHDYEYPKVSIVIPAFNCAQTISATLDSLLNQNYPEFEAVIIDSDSQDRTREIIKRYRDDRLVLHCFAGLKRYEMMNIGITYSQGEYINFLFPGDFYVSRDTLKQMMSLALTHHKPDLVYCGTLLRDGKSEVKILYRALDISLLKRGQQPTSLQSCWFKNSVFSEIGKFEERLRLRGGFDLLCRFCAHQKYAVVSMPRVFTDYDLRWVSKAVTVRHFMETWSIIYKYFGIKSLIRWIFIQKDLARFIKLWIRSAKIAFTGR